MLDKKLKEFNLLNMLIVVLLNCLSDIVVLGVLGCLCFDIMNEVCFVEIVLKVIKVFI